jgi:hypothetical protein
MHHTTSIATQWPYQLPHSNNHTTMPVSMPFNVWAHNAFGCVRHLIPSLHFTSCLIVYSHCIVTQHYHQLIPPPHPSSLTTIITARPQVHVLTLAFIFTSAPCCQRKLTTPRWPLPEAKWRGECPCYTNHQHHHTTNTKSTTTLRHTWSFHIASHHINKASIATHTTYEQTN